MMDTLENYRCVSGKLPVKVDRTRKNGARVNPCSCNKTSAD